jgi:hypothetical protein
MIDTKLYADQRVRKGSRYEQRREGRSHRASMGGLKKLNYLFYCWVTRVVTRGHRNFAIISRSGIYETTTS